MQQRPFAHEAPGARRQVSVDHGQGVDLHDGLISAVAGVKVRRRVVVEVQADDDPVEPASSGIAQELSGSGHHFVNGFAGDLEVQRVGA